MAVRNIAVTDTLETFRTEFNDLAANDFGDIANLSGAITSTNLVDAMNETISIATSTAGWTIEDSSSTQQIVGGGDTLRVINEKNLLSKVSYASTGGGAFLDFLGNRTLPSLEKLTQEE